MPDMVSFIPACRWCVHTVYSSPICQWEKCD